MYHTMIYTLLSHWYPAAMTFYGLCLRTPYVLAMKLSLSEIHNTGELFLQNDSSADNAFGSLIASNGRAPIRQGMSADLKALNAELNCKSDSLAARERWGREKRERIEKWWRRWKCFPLCPPDTLPICMSTSGPFCTGNQWGLAGWQGTWRQSGVR